MYIVACYNIWDDDPNLKMSLKSIENQVNQYIFVLGPYKGYPLYPDQEIEETNEDTCKLIKRTLGDKFWDCDRRADKFWESEIEKRNAYMIYMSALRTPEILEELKDGEDVWMLIIDSDEIFMNQLGLALNKLGDIPKDINFLSIPIYQKGMMWNDLRLPIRLIRYPPEGLEYKHTHFHIFYNDKLITSDYVLWDYGIMNMVGNRPADRIAQQEMYYREIVEKKLEKNVLYQNLMQYSRVE